jgi:cytochrome oxidase Cu insertion factor (SCO1/SenC/PrrC family)
VYTAVVTRMFLLLAFVLAAAPGEAAPAADPAAQLELVRPGRVQSAKPFEVPTPEGARLTLAEFRGRVVLLNFWAT